MNAALARFALVGLAGSLVYFTLLWSMVDLLHWPVIPASCSAFLLVVAENYLLHRAWTFHSTAPHSQALPGFVLVSVAGCCVNGVVMALGVEWLGLNYLAVQLVAIGTVVACNFVGAQRIFRARRTFSHGKDTA
ncbi:GtrA family protein [Massilia sp. CMS3.1]|uniref:GtrA family protein n=1 Tax=Massilia sp. CMS3.1 TaxID=3373083 RepID=UPI003EE5BDB7